jgi:hypothetical protein
MNLAVTDCGACPPRSRREPASRGVAGSERSEGPVANKRSECLVFVGQCVGVCPLLRKGHVALPPTGSSLRCDPATPHEALAQQSTRAPMLSPQSVTVSDEHSAVPIVFRCDSGPFYALAGDPETPTRGGRFPSEAAALPGFTSLHGGGLPGLLALLLSPPAACPVQASAGALRGDWAVRPDEQIFFLTVTEFGVGGPLPARPAGEAVRWLEGVKRRAFLS